MKKRIIIPAISLILFLIKAGLGWAVDWHDTSWSCRQQITISSSMVANTDQANFPVLIKITDQSNSIFGKAQSDADDILFTSSDGLTKLDHEIEYYKDTTTKELDAWVRIPALPVSGNTTICMYYGNGSVSSQQNAAGVWNSDYKMVQHMKDTTTSTTTDSTSNSNNGTKGAVNQPLEADGKIGKAQTYSPTDLYYINAGTGTSLDITGAFTIELWFKDLSGSAGTQIMFSKGETGADKGNNYVVVIDSAKRAYFSYGDGVNFRNFTTTYVFSDTNWHHVVFVFISSTNMSVYVDGSSKTGTYTGTSGISPAANIKKCLIGAGVTTPTGYQLDGGSLDEVRLSNTARSADWITTCYNNQNSPGTYLTVGSEEMIMSIGGSYDGHSVAASSDAAVGFSTATKLAFTSSPSNASPGDNFVTQPVVAVQDTYSNTVTTAVNNITLSISNNPGSGTLSGTATVAAVSGVATFSGLSINKEGDAYTLQAAAAGLTSATSSSFNIVSLSTVISAVTTVQTQVTNVQTDVTSILEDTGTTLPGTLTTISGKIDTMSAKVDSILEDTGTTLPGTLTTIEGKIDTIDTVVDAILVDTGTDLPAAITTAQANVINELAKGVKAKILNRETAAKTGDTITIRYKATSGLSPTIDVYCADNDKHINAAAMTEIGTTGIYEYDLTLTSGMGTGDFTIVCSEATESSIDSMVLAVTASGTTVDLSAIETKVDTLTTNLNTLDTNIDSVQAVVGAISDTTASSTLYGKLSGVTSNVSAIVTKWGSYTADDLVGNTSDLEGYLGTPDDAASEDTVFGKIAAIDDSSGNSGLISTAATYAQNAYDEIQKLRAEIDFNGKTETAYNMLVGLKDTISGLRERVDSIPSEVATPSADKVAASLNKALSDLKEKAALAGYPGVAAEAEEIEAKTGEGGAVDLNTLKNQLSELKALLETVKGLMDAEEEKPVIESWLEMGS